jgi:hypothetical protein
MLHNENLGNPHELEGKYPEVFEAIASLTPEGYELRGVERNEESFERWSQSTGGSWESRVAPGEAVDIQHYENRFTLLGSHGREVQDPDLAVAVVEVGSRTNEGISDADNDKWVYVTFRESGVKEVQLTEKERLELETVQELIEKYGKPRTIVHKQYQHGTEHTEGVLTKGCCNACAYEGQVERGHFACSAPSEDLTEAEEMGIVSRVFQGNQWWVVLDQRFSSFYKEEDASLTSGWGEENN